MSEEEYKEALNEQRDLIEALNDDILTLEKIIDNYELKEADLIESIANRLESPTLRHWTLSRTVEWLVDKVIELEKERVYE